MYDSYPGIDLRNQKRKEKNYLKCLLSKIDLMFQNQNITKINGGCFLRYLSFENGHTNSIRCQRKERTHCDTSYFTTTEYVTINWLSMGKGDKRFINILRGSPV